MRVRHLFCFVLVALSLWLVAPKLAGPLSAQTPASQTPAAAEPKPADPRSRARQFWNGEYEEGKALLRKEASPLLIGAIEGRKPGTALDLGMGQGRNALYLAEKGWETTGVDLSDVGVEQARQSAKSRGLELNAVVSDLDAFDFGREKWDLITSFYMHAWHRRSQTDVPKRIYDALKPGGLLVIEGFAEPPNRSGLQTERLEKEFGQMRILRKETVPDYPAWYRQEQTPLVRFVAEKPKD